MKLLALDTSSIACSVALQLDNALTELHEEQPREHTVILMPMIRKLLDDAGVSLPDLDAIVLGNGPGSFIGMRIAASVAQGLAFGANLRIVPVSSMLAVAAQVFDEQAAAEVCVAQDAHMHEVYLGHYGLRDGVASALQPECLHGMGSIVALAEPGSGPRIAAGFGWQRYPELLAANRDRFDAISDVVHPRARHLFGAAIAGLQQGAGIAPTEVAPAYLRQKVAAKPADSS